MARAVKIASTPASGGGTALGIPAPDVTNFQAGHWNGATYLPTFYWNDTGDSMFVDLTAQVPADLSNFGGVQFMVTYPDGAGGTMSETISERLFYAPGTADHTFQPGANYTLAVGGNVPQTAELWTVEAHSFNKDPQPMVNPTGPTVSVMTVAPLNAGPPQPTAAQIAIGTLIYQYDSTNTPIAQVPVTINLWDPTIDKFYIWWTIANSPPPLSAYTNTWPVAQVATSGSTSTLFNVPRPVAGSSPETLYLIVLAASKTYDRAPVASDPVKTVTLNPVSMPSQVTSFSISFYSQYAGGVLTGFLTYNFHVPNDPEIAYVNIMRVECDDPSLHGGAYVPKAGKDFGDVADWPIDPSMLGTDVSKPVTMPLDPANNGPSWWTFKAESWNRENMRNTTADPTFNLACTAVSKIDTTQLATPIQTGQLANQIINSLSLFPSNILPLQVVASLPALPNSNYPVGSVVYLNDGVNNKLYRNKSGAWSASASADDLTTGTIAANIAYMGAIAVNQLTAGTCYVTGAIIFQNALSGAYVSINSAGAAVVDGNNQVYVTSSGILVQAGTSGPFVQVQPTGITIQQSGSGGPNVVVNATSITLTNGSSQLSLSSSQLTLSNGSYSVQITAGSVALYGPGTAQLVLTSANITLRPNVGSSNGFTINSDGSVSITSGGYTTNITGNALSNGYVTTAVLSASVQSNLTNIVFPWSNISATATSGSYGASPDTVAGYLVVQGNYYGTLYTFKIPFYNP